jgi:hypothetical protein
MKLIREKKFINKNGILLYQTIEYFEKNALTEFETLSIMFFFQL